MADKLEKVLDGFRHEEGIGFLFAAERIVRGTAEIMSRVKDGFIVQLFDLAKAAEELMGTGVRKVAAPDSPHKKRIAGHEDLFRSFFNAKALGARCVSGRMDRLDFQVSDTHGRTGVGLLQTGSRDDKPSHSFINKILKLT